MPSTKLDLHQQAEALYVKTNLSKTEIAKILGLSRRTVQYWSGNYEWDRLKKSKAIMPGLIVENLHFIMLRLQKKILSSDRAFIDPKPEEIKMLCQLGGTIKKLNTRSTLNETVELRDHLMDYINTIDHDMALTFQPFIDGFLRNRAQKEVFKVTNSKLDSQGCLIEDQPEDNKEFNKDIDTELHWDDHPEDYHDGLTEDGHSLSDDEFSFTEEELAEIRQAYQAKCEKDNKINNHIVTNHQAEKDAIAHELNHLTTPTNSAPATHSSLESNDIPNTDNHTLKHQSRIPNPQSPNNPSQNQSQSPIARHSHSEGGKFLNTPLNRRQRRLLLKKQQTDKKTIGKQAA